MYKALVFTLFISTAYVQCAPQEIAEEYQETEFQTFCDLDSSVQVSFLQCVQGKGLVFKEYLEKKSTTVDDFLAEICKDGVSTPFLNMISA
uniref:Putative secreted protein n=1 Tax=Amblyomma triste TaxID=251400 RepID=A0A023G195_AMBTT